MKLDPFEEALRDVPAHPPGHDWIKTLAISILVMLVFVVGLLVAAMLRTVFVHLF
jgi:hypothetical protein